MERSEWNTTKTKKRVDFFFSSIVAAACNVWWSTILVLLSFRSTPTKLRQQISLEVGNTIHLRHRCEVVCSYITATVFYLQRWYKLCRLYVYKNGGITQRTHCCFAMFCAFLFCLFLDCWVLFSDVALLWRFFIDMVFMHIVPMRYSSTMFCIFFAFFCHWIFETFFTT